jgi:hypothetical protein
VEHFLIHEVERDVPKVQIVHVEVKGRSNDTALEMKGDQILSTFDLTRETLFDDPDNVGRESNVDDL